MIKVGDKFWAQQSVDENIKKLASLATWLIYDPNYVKPVDLDPDANLTQLHAQNYQFWGGNSSTLLAAVRNVDGVEQPGTIVVSYQSNPFTEKDGPGQLYGIEFEAVEAGDTNIYMMGERTQLISLSQEINATLEDASFIVDGDGGGGLIGKLSITIFPSENK